MALEFDLKTTDGRARRATITMDRGTIETPVFMPVGTAATVKGVLPRDLRDMGTQISLANTYHLHIQPGEALVEKAGGLHQFMAMPWPLLTDSGGFQVFSLPKKEISEAGVVFEFRKGSKPIHATPEWSMQVQMALGADIVMAFDECVAYPCEPGPAEAAMHRTLRWLDRCTEALTRRDQNLFGIVQGSIYSDLRRASAEATVQRDLPGYAIGGVSVGEGHTLMMKAVDDAEPWMPSDRPRYLMGVGLPEDIVGAVGRGMDMFDCVIPTRYGRSGTVFTTHGRIRVTDRGFRNDMYPLDPSCSCYACTNFSRAYVHHMLKSDELLGTMLCSMHNVAHYHALMESIRAAIEKGRYRDFCAEFEATYLAGDRARRREEHAPGLFASFAPGAAERRLRDHPELAERDAQLASRNPHARELPGEGEEPAASRAQQRGDGGRSDAGRSGRGDRGSRGRASDRGGRRGKRKN